MIRFISKHPVIFVILMLAAVRATQLDWENAPFLPRVIQQKQKLAEDLLKNAQNCKTEAEGIEVFGCPNNELHRPEDFWVKAWIVNNNNFQVRIKKYQAEYRAVQYLKLFNPGEVNYDIVGRWTSYSVYDLNGAEIAYIRPFGLGGKAIDPHRRKHLDNAYGKYVPRN